MQNDEQLKINELKNIIAIGEKLKKDVRPDKKKLEILIGRQNTTTTNIEKNPPQEKKVIPKVELANNIQKSEPENIDMENPIRSISTEGNKIVIKFNKNYVKNDIKGDIARAYLYMSKTYNINLSDQEKKLMEAWDRLDPISEWEIEKNKRIEKIK